MRKEIKYKVSFADSEISNYTRQQDKCCVKLLAWNKVELTVSFFDVIGLGDYGIGNVSAFIEENGHSFLFEKVLAETYEQVPANHQYKLYQFLNLDDTSLLEIVARSFEIS